MSNPSIKELHNSDEFELIAELNHKRIKNFVLDQLAEGGKIVRFFMIYQIVMIFVGLFFLTRSFVLAFQDNLQPLYFTIGALVFCFSVLIILHELLHGIALKLTGAKRVNYGGYFKKFIFYAEADRHVLNRKQFAFIALTPLVFVQITTLIGAVLSFHHPVFYFVIFIMSAHSLFCAGDIGLLSVFSNSENTEIFTFDEKAKKTSYYFRKLKGEELNNSDV